MGLINIVLTIFYFIIILMIASFLRNRFTDQNTSKYFIPALGVKMLGAIALGFIYEFYYGYAGDTFGYYYNPGNIITETFLQDPSAWFRLVFFPNEFSPELYQYSSRIFTYADTPTYFVARFVGFFGVFTLGSYYATALCFATLSFTGVWALYRALYKLYPQLHFQLAIACLFVPSVWFWGSGILKDSLTLAAMGWFIYGSFEILFHRRYTPWPIIVLVVSFFILYTVKVYILLCLVPAMMLMFGFTHYKKIRNPALRIMSMPFLISLVLIGGYMALVRIGESSARYNIDNLAFTASETAQWLEYVGEQQAGSVYTLGNNDFSPGGMLSTAPLAIVTGLFRPFIWEAGNPVMILSGLENLVIIILIISLSVRTGIPKVIASITGNPLITFCFIFSVAFAFAIGISTYNFGSLVRYRIPLIPLMLAGVFISRYVNTSVANSR